MWCERAMMGAMTDHRIITEPDFPLIHVDLIARGIPCHVVSEGRGEWTGVAIGYRVHPVISVAWVDGAYEITFPCGMRTASMRTSASAASVAGEMAWQYTRQNDNNNNEGE